MVKRIELLKELLTLPEARGAERERLLEARLDYVRRWCTQKYPRADFGPGDRMSVKLILPDHMPGGALKLVGLIIGPRGNTQKRMQEETNCTIAVRGKGTRRLGDQVRDESDNDPPHVLIRGPTKERLEQARRLIETLLDFTSEEGERMRR